MDADKWSTLFLKALAYIFFKTEARKEVQRGIRMIAGIIHFTRKLDPTRRSPAVNTILQEILYCLLRP